MAITIQDLKKFAQGLNKEKIRRDDLEFEIMQKYGCSDYLIKSRMKFLILSGIIKSSVESNDVFDIRK